MDKYTIIANYIRNTKKKHNDLLSENIRLSLEVNNANKVIEELKADILELKQINSNDKVNAGVIGAIVGFGVGKV